MRRLRPIVLAAFSLPAMLGAQESCAWLNSASAAGVLGGAVRSAITHTNVANDDGNCYFVRQQGSVIHALRIEVQTMSVAGNELAPYAPRCRSNATPLKAISNEAFACSVLGNAGQRSEQIVGTVRNRAFVIRVSTNDVSATSNSIREKARKVAEQVAGNLF
jgi:hypothetical protein